MSQLPLRKVLAELDKDGLVPLVDFPARFGRRAVRVVELLGSYVMIQPVDDPRSWELALTDLITVNPSDIRAHAEPRSGNGP